MNEILISFCLSLSVQLKKIGSDFGAVMRSIMMELFDLTSFIIAGSSYRGKALGEKTDERKQIDMGTIWPQI